jgi:hypothetical protein
MCALWAGFAASPVAMRRPTLIRASYATCKTAACTCAHMVHDKRCLPGEGRQVKYLAPQRRRGWRAAPAGGTLEGCYAPSRRVGAINRANTSHPTFSPCETCYALLKRVCKEGMSGRQLYSTDISDKEWVSVGSHLTLMMEEVL